MPVEVLTAKTVRDAPAGVVSPALASSRSALATPPGTPPRSGAIDSPYRVNRTHKTRDSNVLTVSGGGARARGRSLMGPEVPSRTATTPHAVNVSAKPIPGEALNIDAAPDGRGSSGAPAGPSKAPASAPNIIKPDETKAEEKEGTAATAVQPAETDQGAAAAVAGAKPKPVIHIDHVVFALLALLMLLPLILCWFLLPRWLMAPSMQTLSGVLAIGVGIGLAFSFLYHNNTREKTHICQVVSRREEGFHAELPASSPCRDASSRIVSLG